MPTIVKGASSHRSVKYLKARAKRGMVPGGDAQVATFMAVNHVVDRMFEHFSHKLTAEQLVYLETFYRNEKPTVKGWTAS